MKISIIKLWAFSIIIIGCATFLTNCKKHDDPTPLPEISGFSPESGITSATVTISGKNFKEDIFTNQVFFNETPATITQATKTELTVAVPAGATTGKISVIVNGGAAISATDFVVNQPPSITSFSPESGTVSTTVTITGINFSATPANNVVKFNTTTATVTAATSTQLTTSIPAGATTGKISVQVNGITATSTTDFVVNQPPTITSFSPLSGAATGSVTIIGTNFSTTPANNVVKFNGTTATVTAATATQLTTSVPAGVATGKISVTTSGLTATSAIDFTVIPTPTITSFTPEYGQIAASVVITGTNFASVTTDNAVKFNGTAATVSLASSTSLTVTVPASATSGKISVTVNGATGNSSKDFLVGCPDLIITIKSTTNISGNNYTVNYEIKNTGAVPMDISKIFIQSYQSSNATYDGGDQAAGGFADYGSSEPLMQPNEVRQKSQSISANISIATYPYVLFQLVSSAPGPSIECSTSNNLGSYQIQ